MLIHKHDRVHPRHLRIPNETHIVMVCGAVPQSGEGKNFIFMQDWNYVTCEKCLVRKSWPFESTNAARQA